MRIRREVVAALGALVLTACAAAGADSSSDATTDTTVVPSTVGDVGVLPEPVTTDTLADVATTTVTSTTDVVDTAPVETEPPAGATAAGNRVLLIGDSILASTSRRYTNDTCLALVPLGWQVEVEAEVSQPIAFADEVLDARLKAGWDAAVIFLGTNYGGDEKDYLRRLNDAITRLGNIPIVLITITDRGGETHEVNDTIRSIQTVYPNLSLVDWQQITADRPSLLREDGIHPTTEGRQVLAAAIAERLGVAPTQPGSCLKSTFTDDSAGSVEGSGSSGGKPTATTRPSTGVTTTVKPASGATTTTKPPTGATTTTVKPAGSTTTSPVTTTGSTTGSTTATTTASTPASTSPPVTSPPATNPPATNPPATNPPATNPPATSPPSSGP